jgi:hypothetical protein
MNKKMRLITATVVAGSMAIIPMGVGSATVTPTAPSSPASVLQWDEIAANTVVKSGVFQNEGLLYMAYASSAVYDVVSAAQDRDRTNSDARIDPDAAVVEAAYETLVHYFPAPRPAGSPDLDALHTQALAAIPDGLAKAAGVAAGQQAANDVIDLRAGDGRRTPFGSPRRSRPSRQGRVSTG